MVYSGSMFYGRGLEFGGDQTKKTEGVYIPQAFSRVSIFGAQLHDFETPPGGLYRLI